MNENNVFAERTEEWNVAGGKKTHTPALVMGVLSIVFGLMFALIGDILGIIGIVMSMVKRKKFKTKAALICSIIGLVLAIANHILGFVLSQG